MISTGVACHMNAIINRLSKVYARHQMTLCPPKGKNLDDPS